MPISCRTQALLRDHGVNSATSSSDFAISSRIRSLKSSPATISLEEGCSAAILDPSCDLFRHPYVVSRVRDKYSIIFFYSRFCSRHCKRSPALNYWRYETLCPSHGRVAHRRRGASRHARHLTCSRDKAKCTIILPIDRHLQSRPAPGWSAPSTRSTSKPCGQRRTAPETVSASRSRATTPRRSIWPRVWSGTRGSSQSSPGRSPPRAPSKHRHERRGTGPSARRRPFAVALAGDARIKIVVIGAADVGLGLGKARKLAVARISGRS